MRNTFRIRVLTWILVISGATGSALAQAPGYPRFAPAPCGYRPPTYAPYGYIPNPYPMYAPPRAGGYGPGPYPVYGPPRTGWPMFVHFPPNQPPLPMPAPPPPPYVGNTVTIPSSQTGPYQFWTAPPPSELPPVHTAAPGHEPEAHAEHADDTVAEAEHGTVEGHEHHEGLSCFRTTEPSCSHCWVNADYLLWWIRPSPVPVPVVTTGAAGSMTGGAITDPSTVVLFGNSSLDYAPVSGLRIGGGFWLDSDRAAAVEASGFALTHASRQASLASDTFGNPRLVIPFQDENGVEQGLILSDPVLGSTGDVSVRATSQFWGAEVNGKLRVLPGDNLYMDVLLGVRYLNLDESLEIKANSSEAVNFSFSGSDRFGTSNHFYGGQIGTRIGCRWWRMTADATVMVALGRTEQKVNVAGETTLTTANPLFTPGTFPGFLFTQPTNIGSVSTRQFSAIPQVQLKVGLDLMRHVRTTIGYDFLYWANVVRPGNQIDRVVNASQAAAIQGGPGVLTGAARPTVLRNEADLWVHGLMFGLEFHW